MSRVGKTEAKEIPGTGACPEAQADGVPCIGTSSRCDECRRAGFNECRCGDEEFERRMNEWLKTGRA